MNFKTISAVFIVLTLVFLASTAYLATSPPKTTTFTSVSTMTITTTAVSPSVASSTMTSSSVAPTVIQIAIENGAVSDRSSPYFSPDAVTLVLSVNNTVTWTNEDTAAHTVTCTSPASGAPDFDSGNLNPGATFTYTFTVAGTYNYFSSYQTGLTGTITVVA
jgi:plastocyanin